MSLIPKVKNQKYAVSRRAFVNWAMKHHKSRVDKALLLVPQDLICGGEFILTAEDLLAKFTAIPVQLLFDYSGDDLTVPADECHLKLYK